LSKGKGSLKMKLSARIPVGAALLLVLASTVGCTKLRARDQLVKGVQAFKSGKYEEAVNHFQTSITLDPDYDVARVYLATAYSYQVVANLDTPDNIAIANKALENFDYVLAKKPDDLDSLRQVAAIERNVKEFDKAKATEEKILSIKPDDAEAAYTIGSIDWNLAFDHSTKILAAAGMTDDGQGNVKMSKDTCAKLVAANSALVDEALKYLQMAIDHKAEYADAMDYLQLTYRRKAELECGNDGARKADLAQADMWTQKSMGARKAIEAEKEEKASHGVDVSK
jgi:tetratricopeptide (TPR) repeat protein